MEEVKKQNINWLGGGTAIVLATITDCVMVFLYFILIGIVVNFIVAFCFLFGFGLWLAVKKEMTLQRGLVLGQAIFSSLIPFVLTTTISIMIAKIIAQNKLGSLAPGIAKSLPKLPGTK